MYVSTLCLYTTTPAHRKILLHINASEFQSVFLYIRVSVHCNKNPIYVFSEKELRGLSPNFRIHVSVSDLYISRIGPHIFLQQNRQVDPWNI
jgi:hypothetical protein